MRRSRCESVGSVKISSSEDSKDTNELICDDESQLHSTYASASKGKAAREAGLALRIETRRASRLRLQADSAAYPRSATLRVSEREHGLLDLTGVYSSPNLALQFRRLFHDWFQ